MLCTTSRARKVVVALTLVALIDAVIDIACKRLFETFVAYYINMITFHAVVPVAVLIINMIVVREVRRRASSNAASNLGIQHPGVQLTAEKWGSRSSRSLVSHDVRGGGQISGPCL